MRQTAASGSRYTEAVSALEKMIETGAFPYGERLPNEKWLCEKLCVSRPTLRKAMDEIIAAGLAERRPNKGIYVTYSKFGGNFDRPYSVYQELLRAGIRPSSKILSFALTEADSALSEIMSCPVGEPLLEFFRVRYADERPFNINHIRLIERFFPQFNPWLLTERSLHEIMKTDYKLDIAQSVQYVSAALATTEQAKHLEVPIRTPLLTTSSIVTAEDGCVISHQLSWINTDVVPYSYKCVWR